MYLSKEIFRRLPQTKRNSILQGSLTSGIVYVYILFTTKSIDTIEEIRLFNLIPTRPSLPDFCNGFSKWKIQLNSVNTSFRTKKKNCFSNVCKLRKTLFYGKLIRGTFLKLAKF